MSMHQASAAASYFGREPGNFPRGIEPAGTRLQRLAQQLIHRGRSGLGRCDGTLSFGRSVAAFLPDVDAGNIPAIANKFRRLLVLGCTREVSCALRSEQLKDADISGHMPIIGADHHQFTVPATSVLNRFGSEMSERISLLAEDAGAGEINELQALQIAAGLTPLPGVFLRGGQGRVVSVLVRDAEGRLLASATLADLSDAGPQHTDTAIMVGVSVAPDAQGRGLGAAVTAAGLIEAYHTLGASRVIAVVSPTNTRAFRTNAKFRMQALCRQSAVYVEVSGGG